MRGLYGGLIRTAPETALKACCTTSMGIDTSSLRSEFGEVTGSNPACGGKMPRWFSGKISSGSNKIKN